MPDGPRARSVIETIRPFRWRIAFTYALNVIEDLLELAYPWATGLAINGLLAQDYRMIAPVMIAWVLHAVMGCGRQMYDTRLYTRGLQHRRDRYGAAPAAVRHRAHQGGGALGHVARVRHLFREGHARPPQYAGEHRRLPPPSCSTMTS